VTRASRPVLAERILLVAALYRRRLYLAAAALMAAGCTPNALVHQWRSHEHTGRPFDHVLVLAASPDVELERVYEDAFVQELAAMGVTAVAAHAVFQADGEVPEERIRQAVSEVNADAVLTMRMLGKDAKTGAYSPPPLQPGVKADFYSVYQVGMNKQTPSEPYGYGVYTLETSLWDAKDEALVWSSTSQTFQLRSAAAAAKELSDAVVNALRQQQLL
jgi:hypothetical protein